MATGCCWTQTHGSILVAEQPDYRGLFEYAGGPHWIELWQNRADESPNYHWEMGLIFFPANKLIVSSVTSTLFNGYDGFTTVPVVIHHDHR